MLADVSCGYIAKDLDHIASIVSTRYGDLYVGAKWPGPPSQFARTRMAEFLLNFSVTEKAAVMNVLPAGVPPLAINLGANDLWPFTPQDDEVILGGIQGFGNEKYKPCGPLTRALTLGCRPYSMEQIVVVTSHRLLCVSFLSNAPLIQGCLQSRVKEIFYCPLDALEGWNLKAFAETRVNCCTELCGPCCAYGLCHKYRSELHLRFSCLDQYPICIDGHELRSKEGGCAEQKSVEVFRKLMAGVMAQLLEKKMAGPVALGRPVAKTLNPISTEPPQVQNVNYSSIPTAKGEDLPDL